MSGESDSDAEKSHEPTQRRLDDLRKQGDRPRSQDLMSAASLLGLSLSVTMAGGMVVNRFADVSAILLGQPDRLASRMLQGRTLATAAFVPGFLAALGVLFVIPPVLVVGSALAQRSLSIVPSRIRPRWSRLSPIAGAKSRFGREGLVSFLRSLAKAGAVLAALVLVVGPALPELLVRFDLTAGPASFWMTSLALRLVATSAVLGLVFGGGDYLWQWWLFRQRARMTREEVKAEMKDSEGDPHLKAHRRQRAQEIALNKMLADVKTADVVIVNPTHYAVALKWKRTDRTPPLVVAKGVDEIAARIRERAAEAGVPIFSDPPTARALHASVDVGRAIRHDHFKAVAAAIRFAETMRRRAKGRVDVR